VHSSHWVPLVNGLEATVISANLAANKKGIEWERILAPTGDR